jgi:hypothetical protein
VKPADPPASPAAPEPQIDVVKLFALRDARDELKAKHPNLDPALLADYATADSPEALRAKVETHVANETAMKDRLKAEADAEVRAAYEAKYGPIESEVQGNQAPEGELTLERYRALPFAERQQIQREHPEAVAKILNAE